MYARISQYLESICGNQSDFYDLITARRRSGSNIVHLLNDGDKKSFSTEEEYVNAATNVSSLALLRKDSDELEIDEYNLIYRVLNKEYLSDAEKSLLSKKYPLPKVKKVGLEWVEENLNFLIKVCEDIWINSPLDGESPAANNV